MNVLCLGASFTGRYLADHFPDHSVWFLSRNPESLSAAGYEPFLADRHSDQIEAILDTVPAVLAGESLAPPLYEREVEQVRARRRVPIVHVSSTSVFAKGSVRQADPDALPVLDETAAPDPDLARGRLRLAMEERFQSAHPDGGILRSTGIYGPGRCLALSFRNGDFRRVGASNPVVSRIHVHDLARLFLAMCKKFDDGDGDGMPPVVHAVDRRPTANQEVFTFLERELDIQLPDAGWRTAPAEGRRIRSLHAEELLGNTYRFESYIEGFRDCLARTN